MNTVMSAMSEYDLELPKSIKALQRQLIRLQNNAPVTKNPTALPPLPMAESDEEDNDSDVPPLPLENSDDEESDTQAHPLPPPVDIGEEGKTSDETSFTSHGSTLALGSQMKKFFQGLGWFSGEVVDHFLDENNTQVYTIRFTDSEEEMWSVHDATLNAEAASVTVGKRRFQLIRKFRGGGHFSGTVVEILYGGKKKCKFCDGDEYIYILNEIQRLLTLQVVSELLEKTSDTKREDDVSVYCPKEENSGKEETMEK